MSTIPAKTILVDGLLPARQSVRGELSRLRGQIRVAQMLAGLLAVGKCGLALVAISFYVDWFLRVDSPTRLLLLVIMVAIFGGSVYRYLIRPLMHRLDDLELAELLDRRRAEMGQQIANVLQLPELLVGADQASPALVHAAVCENAEPLKRVDWRGFVDRQKRVWVITGLVGALLYPLWMYLAWPLWCDVWAQRWLGGSDIRWPQHTYLQIEKLDESDHFLVPRGESIVVDVHSRPELQSHGKYWQLVGRGEPFVVGGPTRLPLSRDPERVSVTSKTESGKVRRGNLTQVGEGRFRYEFLAVTSPRSFWLEANDDWLGPVRLVPVDRPQVQRIVLHVQQPGSDVEEPLSSEDLDSQLGFLTGSRIRLVVESSQPLSSAEFETNDGPSGLMQPLDSNRFSQTWQLDQPLSLEIRLTSKETSLESKPYFLTIGIREDHSPRVTLRSTGVGRRITPEARIPTQLRATDDVGIEQLSMELETTMWGDVASGTEGETSGEPQIQQPQTEEPQTEEPQTEEPQTEEPQTEELQTEELQKGEPQTSHESWLLVDDTAVTTDAWQIELSSKEAVDLRGRGVVPATSLKLRATAVDRSPLGARTGQSRWLTFQVVTSDELFYEILVRQRAQRTRFEKVIKSMEEQSTPLAAVAEPSDVMPVLRVQKVMARQVWQVAGKLEQALEELRNNRLGTQKAWDLMSETIIAPLRELHRGELSQLGVVLVEINTSLEPSADRLSLANELQEMTVAKMRQILGRMSQWESFVDVVNQLRHVIDFQSTELEATEQLRQKETDELFDE